MIELFMKKNGDATFSVLDSLQDGCWINVSDTKDQDLKTLSEWIDIDFDHLQDSLDHHEIPRVEHQKKNIIFYTRHAYNAEDDHYTITLTIIITNKYFVTISPKFSDIIAKILKNVPPLSTKEHSKMLLHILFSISQDFNLNIKKTRHVVAQQKQNIDSFAIESFTKNEDVLNQYLSSLVPMRSLLESLASGRFVHLYEKYLDLLQDVTIALTQAENFCSVSIKSLRSLRDAYQIMFTNDLNKTIKRLTSLTVILTIPTIVSSIYGMNVALPLEKDPMIFSWLIGGSAVSCFVLYCIFSKIRWM